MKGFFISIACLLLGMACPAQKKITILGSSTAYGYGALVQDSSWVGRLQTSFRKNTTDGIDTTIDNRAVPGYVTYQSLPTGSPIPPNRPSPDPLNNVTYVLNDFPRPNIVIINYPTNDIVNNYDPKEMMDNLRVMFQQFNSNGITCYISTSQPRNTATDLQRTLLRQIVDSIKNTFGVYAINFWDDLVTSDGSNMLRPEISDDGTHPNNYGHRLLFQRVVAKNIFSSIVGAPLPLVLKSWDARLENNSVELSWATAYEQNNTSFEIQRSQNGIDFQTLCQRNGLGPDAHYLWTDAQPLSGRNFYRLKVNENHTTVYSSIIAIVNSKKQLISGFYLDDLQLHLQLHSNGGSSAQLEIIDHAGVRLSKQVIDIRGSDNSITVPVTSLRPGAYFLRVTTSNQLTATQRFIILK